MDKADYFSLTNQPETCSIPPPLSLRVVECCRVAVEYLAEMDKSEIFVFSGDVGDGKAKIGRSGGSNDIGHR